MSTKQPNPEERLAREQFTQKPFYVGTDGDGAAHY
jgi:hypothetical protein